ncbi:MAG: extracellular solute-binding protein [Defluviitaleaceae bacterium]|nr:extracellular solute-binding protein [Defluviitaleaceae bacterium]
MKFKLILYFFALFLLIFALSACGANGINGNGETVAHPTPPPRHSDPDTTVLTVAWWGGDIRHERTRKVLRLFEEQNPGIRIEEEYFAFDGFFANLNSRVASGDVWDVFQQGGTYHEYIDYILPLNDLIESGHIDISRTDSEMMALTTTTGGYIVGISNGVNAWGIAYDALMFDELGIPRPEYQWTWEDFVHAALTIRENRGIWGVGSFPLSGVSLTQYLLQKGSPIFLPYVTDRPGLDSPEPMVSFLQMMFDLADTGAMPNPGEALHIVGIENDPLVFGEAGMSYTTSNQFIALATAALEIDPDRELAMILLPGHAGGTTAAINSSQMMSIHANTRHPEYAARFVNFFANDIDANLILRGERGVSIMSHVRDALAAEAEDDRVIAAANDFVSSIHDFREHVLEASPFGHVFVPIPARGRIENYMGEVIELVIMGRMTPEAGAQAIFDYAVEAMSED